MGAKNPVQVIGDMCVGGAYRCRVRCGGLARQPTPGGPVTMSDGCEEARQLERRLRWQHRLAAVGEPDEPAAQPQEDT